MDLKVSLQLNRRDEVLYQSYHLASRNDSINNTEIVEIILAEFPCLKRFSISYNK